MQEVTLVLTPAPRSDSLFFALRFCRSLWACGRVVNIFIQGCKASECNFHSDLQSFVRDPDSFSDVAARSDVVVFWAPPPQEIRRFLRKEQVYICNFFDWRMFKRSERKAWAAADFVMTPSQEQQRFFVEEVSRKAPVLVAPYAVGTAPLRREPATSGPFGVFWLLDGEQDYFVDLNFFQALLQFFPGSRERYLTIAVSRAVASRRALELRRLQTAADSSARVAVITDCSPEHLVVTASRHDLVIWPATIDSYGIAAAISLTAGVPVLTYDHPVVKGLVRDGVNGFLLPCELVASPDEVPYAVANNARFVDTMSRLSLRPFELFACRPTTELLYQREEQYEAAFVEFMRIISG